MSSTHNMFQNCKFFLEAINPKERMNNFFVTYNIKLLVTFKRIKVKSQ